MLSLLLASFLCLAEPPPVSLMPEHRIMTVKKYTAGVESTGKRIGHPGYGVTASGKKVRRGITCAAGDEFPFGTILLIEGIGFRVVHDRGGAIDNDSVDIYEDSVDDAIAFGRKELKVHIIARG